MKQTKHQPEPRRKKKIYVKSAWNRRIKSVENKAMGENSVARCIYMRPPLGHVIGQGKGGQFSQGGQERYKTFQTRTRDPPLAT